MEETFPSCKIFIEISSSRDLLALDKRECKLVTGLVVFDGQHNNKNENKPMELLTIVLFEVATCFGPHES